MNRVLTQHIVETDQSRQIEITVADEPGAGGANHRYELRRIDFTRNPSASEEYNVPYVILFQNGSVKDNGVNGVTQEVLLAIVLDRLRSFHSGPFSSRENAIALTHVEEALLWLKQRTRDRIARGVEGVNVK